MYDSIKENRFIFLLKLILLMVNIIVKTEQTSFNYSRFIKNEEGYERRRAVPFMLFIMMEVLDLMIVGEIATMH